METPTKLHVFMNMVMKEAQRDSLFDLLEEWDIEYSGYKEIQMWFISHGISI